MQMRKNDQAPVVPSTAWRSHGLQLMDTFATFVDSLAESLDDHEASGRTCRAFTRAFGRA